MNKKISMLTMIIAVSLGTIFIFANTGNLKGDVLSSGKNFKIYDITTDDQPKYRYEIISNSGRVVKTDVVQRIEPKITYLDSESIISISIGAGTGLLITQYYDISSDLFSEVFESPALVAYGNVIYMDAIDSVLVLVIRDIFDKSKKYMEYDFNFSPMANPTDALINAEIIGDKNLLISFYSGTEFDKQTTILNLD